MLNEDVKAIPRTSSLNQQYYSIFFRTLLEFYIGGVKVIHDGERKYFGPWVLCKSTRKLPLLIHSEIQQPNVSLHRVI